MVVPDLHLHDNIGSLQRTGAYTSSRKSIMENFQTPNSLEPLEQKIRKGEIPMRRVWWMLVFRSFFSFGLLLLVAFIYNLSGSRSAFADSSAWWLWFITITNIICILLLIRFGRYEGIRLREVFFFNPASWKKDLLWFLFALAVIAVIAMPPGIILARLFWGSSAVPNKMLIQPLPLAAIYPLFLLMPATQALAELPVYWGYTAPRLRASGMNRWLIIVIVGLVLSIQHMFLSFQMDWHYDLWLALKFLPFSLWTGFIVDRRPTTLPYLMLAHYLLDASTPVLTYLVSQGIPIF